MKQEKESLDDLNLETLNWELCLAYLDDCIKDLQGCQERLGMALGNLDEIKEFTEIM